jgi:hypothetical protein
MKNILHSYERTHLLHKRVDHNNYNNQYNANNDDNDDNGKD